MTDRKLLELAAKAAGVNVSWFQEDGGIATGNRKWNPLTDDGDALRLAVKLELWLGTHCNHEMACASDIYGRCDPQVIKWKANPYAATRRAIVLAAAEIGKELK